MYIIRKYGLCTTTVYTKRHKLTLFSIFTRTISQKCGGTILCHQLIGYYTYIFYVKRKIVYGFNIFIHTNKVYINSVLGMLTSKWFIFC